MEKICSSSFRLLSQATKVCVRQSKSTFRSCIYMRAMSTAKSLDISGIYPPIVTPFDSNEDISWEKLEFNLKKLQQHPLRGYVVQGSNGEYAFMTSEERVEMVRRVKEMVPDDKLIIAGSGCESTRDTINMSKNMAKAGADVVLVITPSYYKSGMTNAALEKHFTKVADESPVPVVLYNIPANTGIDLAPEVVFKVCNHPNIIGLKDSGGDISKIGNMVYKTKDIDFQILAGSAGFLFPAFMAGCVGGVLALANALPGECCQIEKLYRAGQYEEAQKLQQRLIAPNGDVTRKFGVPGLKVAMEWFGFYGGPTRLPLLPIEQEQVNSMKKNFQHSQFL
ncbi:4-hydroxy-2-oxoglutarate aldolase, mitochondrial-like [Lineus longissimus]|uniref:4-hydroxy-2-oxoglutarate aldolase, mitochondrial-like n=1 Tax=Lineus longissimus TaxID=88925 RepID=UPI002B4DD291